MSVSQAPSDARASARRRLLRDLKEFEAAKADFPSVSAAPSSENVFAWHGNLQPTDGPYAGTPFHFVMTFPDDYPKSPPEVQLKSQLAHPNVFGTASYVVVRRADACLLQVITSAWTCSSRTPPPCRTPVSHAWSLCFAHSYR